MHTCTVQGWHTGIAHRYGTHVWHTGMESLLMAHWYGRQLWYTDIHGAPTWHTCMVQRYGTLMANKYGTQIRYTGMAQRYITQWMAQREGGSNGRGKGVRSNTMDPEGTEDSKGRGFGMREGTVGKGGGQPYAFGSAKNRTARQAHDPARCRAQYITDRASLWCLYYMYARAAAGGRPDTRGPGPGAWGIGTSPYSKKDPPLAAW